MGSFVNWLGVGSFVCGGAASIIARIFFTVSSKARTRAMVMGVFQTARITRPRVGGSTSPASLGVVGLLSLAAPVRRFRSA